MPIGHEDRLTLVEHLSELRSRIVISLAAFAVALGICFWQNHALLKIIDDPLKGRKPITFGVTEPFTTTLTVAAYAALILALPIVLYELYAFVLPAFSPHERHVALPLMLMVPFLFVGGAAFGYFLVVPAALKFLINFNQNQFNVQIRARDYYSFVLLTMVACGIVFQVPTFVLALVRTGVTSVQTLRAKRRYAIIVCAVIAAALPGVDPVSMILEMIPLVALYELSILLAAAFGRSSAEAPEQLAAEGS